MVAHQINIYGFIDRKDIPIEEQKEVAPPPRLSGHIKSHENALQEEEDSQAQQTSVDVTN